MKYIKELIGLLIIILLTYLLGEWNYIEKLSILFIPVINRYIYIFFLLSFIYMMGRCILNKTKTNFMGLISTYSIVLFLTLLVREKYDTYQYNLHFYLFDWFKTFAIDKVILVNFIGNLILFAPLGFILSLINKKVFYNILIGMGIIIILELCQFITKRGVFDLVDIILNSIGLILVILGMKGGNVIIWIKIKKTQKQKKVKQKNQNQN